MSIRLRIEIKGPVDEDDRDLLNSSTMILLALASKFADEPTEPQIEKLASTLARPAPCGKKEDGTKRICVGEVGHRGRHSFRLAPN